MLRKSNYRPVAEWEYVGMLISMSEPRYLRCGLLTALVLVAISVKGQAPMALSALRAPVHSISPEIVKAVDAKLPKYKDVAVQKTPEAPSDATKDSPDILHLEKLTVRADRQRLPTDYAMLTPNGRMDLALKTYPGVRIGNFFGANNGYATAMQAEQWMVVEKQAVADAVRNSRTDNGPESKRAERLLRNALAQPSMYWAGQGKP